MYKYMNDTLNETPFKDGKSKLYSKKTINALLGIILILLSIIALINQGGLSSYLFFGISYVFGVFSFIILPLLIIFGIYLVFFANRINYKFNLVKIGLIVLVIFGLLCSTINVENLNLTNFTSLYSFQVQTISKNAIISNTLDINQLQGGFLGYLIASLFLTGIGYLGSYIFTILFLIIGSILVLSKPIYSLVNFILSLKNKKVDKSKVKNDEVVESEDYKDSNSSNDDKDNLNLYSNKVNLFSDDIRMNVKKETSEDSDIKLDTKEEKEEVSPFEKISSSFSPFSDIYVSSKEEKKVDTNPVTKVSELKDTQIVKEVQPSIEVVKEIQPTIIQKEIVTTPIQPKIVIDKKEIEHALIKEYKSNENRNSSPFKDLSYAQQKDYQKPEMVNMETKAIIANDHLTTNDTEIVSLQRTQKITHYPLPSIDLLKNSDDSSKLEINQQAAEEKIEVINGVFSKLHIGARVRNFTIGPSVTRFNIEREDGVKVSEITKNDVLSEMQVDLKGDMTVRIEGVVQGESTSGIEIANPAPMMVSFKECYKAVLEAKDKLSFPLGKNISNNVIVVSLDDMPHLLISGTTGSGKSVFVHSIIMSLIMRNFPDECKFILVDPKQVEFSRYKDMPHLYCPIITNVTQAVAMLKKLTNEMERRYELLSREECSKIQEYQELRKSKPNLENLPNIVCIIDEFADMMSQDPKNVDSYTQRLAQKARAAGIYLIIATQRPSVKNITGTIKANIPARVALMLPTNMDSRTILDEGGAENLLGKGDLLARIPSLKAIVRLQSAFVSNEEISKVVHYLKDQCKPDFDPNFIHLSSNENLVGHLDSTISGRSAGFDDELYPSVKEYVITNKIASTSALSRYFRIGYSRAASLCDALEQEGIIKTTRPGGPKEVVSTNNDSERNEDI